MGLLTDRLFGAYFFAKILSTAGVWVFNIAAAVIVWDISRSTIMVSGVSIALFAPQLALAPISGAWSDQRGPRGQIVVGRLIVAAAAALLAAALCILGADGLPGEWAVIVPSAVAGVGFVVGGPAQLSLLPSLARDSELPAVVALNSLPPTIARAGGPILGAFLLVVAGPASAFAFTALTSLAFAWVVVRLPLERGLELARQADGTVRLGFAHLRADPVVAWLLVGMLAIGLGVDPVVTLTPALAASYGQGAILVGWFATAFGVGAAVGYFGIAPMRAWRGTARVIGMGFTLLAAGMFMAGAVPTVVGAMVGLSVAGVGFCWAMTGTTTPVYERVPERLRGRIMALWSMAFVGSRPLGAAISGALAEAWSVRFAFVAVAGMVTVLAIMCGAGSRRGQSGGVG